MSALPDVPSVQPQGLYTLLQALRKQVSDLTDQVNALTTPGGSGGSGASMPPQFDKTSALATTAWVTRFGHQFSGNLNVIANVTLTAAIAGGEAIFVTNDNTTATLPLISTLANGATVSFVSRRSNCVVKGGGADRIVVGGGVVIPSLTLQPGDWLKLTVELPDVWHVSGGSVAANVPPQADNSARFASTSFVQRALGSFSTFNGLSDGYVFTTANAGADYVSIGGSTRTNTLPVASTCPAGTAITIYNINTPTYTLQRQGSDVIIVGQLAGQTSFTIPAGSALTCVSDGTGGWYCHGPAAQLREAQTATQADSSGKLATTAFVKQASGQFSGLHGFNVNSTLTAFHIGGYLIAFAALTLSLAKVNSVGYAGGMFIANMSPGVLTLAAFAGDTIISAAQAGNGLATLNIPAGKSVEIVGSGTTFWYASGTGA